MIVGGSFSWSLPYNIKWLEATDEVNWCFINQVDFSYSKKKKFSFVKHACPLIGASLNTLTFALNPVS